MRYDIVIIGAGLAGMAAALSALRGKSPGGSGDRCSIAVVAKGAGSFISSTGYIHFLGYYPAASQEPVDNPLESIKLLCAEHPEHPYALAGTEAFNSAVADFLRVTEEFSLPYSGSPVRNKLLPVASGALIPAALVPRSSDKDIHQAGELIVVGLKELMDFYPAWVAENLKKSLPCPISHRWLSLDSGIKRALNSYDIALTLESTQARDQFLLKVKPLITGENLVLLPAVLGLNRSPGNDSELPLLEVPTLPPSVIGIRLGEYLRRYLMGKGVEFIHGVEVRSSSREGRRCTAITASSPSGREKRIEGKFFVLATGGISGGGLEVYPGHMEETVLQIPVESPESWSNDDFFSRQGQPLSRAGVKANTNLQPMKDGEILFENVLVAGSTLGGYDPFVEKSGSGVALVTGYRAGILAAGGV